MHILTQLPQIPTSEDGLPDGTGYNEDLNSINLEYLREESIKAIRTTRSTSEIAAELEADYQFRKSRSKDVKKAAAQSRKPFVKMKKDLELTLLKSGVPYACKNCGTTNNISVDHIVPVKKGGWHTVDNLQFLCRPCNSSKGTKTTPKPDEDGGQVVLF